MGHVWFLLSEKGILGLSVRQPKAPLYAAEYVSCGLYICTIPSPNPSVKSMEQMSKMSRFIECDFAGMLVFCNNIISQDENINSASQKSRVRILRRLHDWFAAQIKRRIENKGNVCFVIKFFQQQKVERIVLAVHKLGSCGGVNMCDSRYLFLPFFFYRNHIEHVPKWNMDRGIFGQIKNAICEIRKNRRCKRTKRFTKFNFFVYNLFHMGVSGIGKNTAIAQRSRSPF